MAFKYFDVTLTAAQLQAITANVYFWIDRQGNLTTTGSATLVATAGVPTPPDQAILQLSQDNGDELYVEHGVLTGAAGGKVSFAEVSPEAPASPPPAGSPIVVGAATTDQAIAATAESVKTAIQAAAPTSRINRGALAILFTTAPSAASPMRIRVYGHRDGVNAAKG